MPVNVFKQDLRVNGRIIQFSFWGFNTVYGKRFFIVVHDDSMHFTFHMRQSKTNVDWVIIDKTPGWIREIEAELSDIIIRQMRLNVA